MADKNDYIDELNWYTEDFDFTKQNVKTPKKEKPSSRSSYSKSSEKEKRLRKTRDSHLPKPSSSNRIKYVDVDDPHRKTESVLSSSEKTKRIKSSERHSSRKREILTIYPSTREKSDSLKREKPDIKLYEPVKLSSRIKEVVISTLTPTTKSIEKLNKSDTISPPGKTEKTEPVKMPEPILINLSKTVTKSKITHAFTEKLGLLEERDKLIRSSMEKPSNLKQARSVKGTCPDMCPEKERLMRCLKKMVSIFECPPNSNEMDAKLAIKEYARSSADQEEPLPHELRPEPVLTMSMSYIITRIITKFEECEDVSAWYDFCWNRLRAIRKDIVQQQLCDLETVTIVEQCARFHIVCFDRFWGADSSIFDEKINTENLMNCLKILLNLYGDLRKQGVVCINEPEFNAYMILIKMNSGDLLWEFLNFPLSVQQTPLVIEAVKIHMFYNSNMYSQFFNYLLKTSYLNACLMQRCFTQLRVNALEAIAKAYCPPNKEGKVSVQHVMKSLKFDSKEDALSFCQSCNIRHIERIGFKISHSTFTRPRTALKVATPSSLVCNKRVEFAQAVVGVDNEMPVYFEHSVHNSFLNEKTLHPDALDASDQEEKMLRDNVERMLLIKNAKNSPVKVSEGKSNTSAPTTPILQRSLSSLSNRRKSIESDASSVKFVEKSVIFSPEPEEEDVEMEELSESEDYDMPDALSELGNTDKSDAGDNEVVFLDADDKTSLESKTETDAGINFDWDSMWQVSPLSAISDEPLEGMEDEEPIKNEPDPITVQVEEKLSPPPSLQFVPTSSFSRTTSSDDSAVKRVTSPTTPKVTERRISVSSSSTTESKFTSYAMKLNNKLKLNLQRLSAKKYGRIWREKVREIKRSYGFIPLISHMNMKEYITIWGRSVTKQNTILNQLNNTKKLCSSVDSLLLFNMFDTSTKHLCRLVSESLVERKLIQTRPFDNIHQMGTIYWKLVISVPVSRVANYDLYQNVLSWSEEVFFSSELARNRTIETTFCKGIKVHCKVKVTEGDKLNLAQNLSALIMLRVPGWETSNESQNRLNKFISLLNHPIPVYIINLAPTDSLLVPFPEQYTSFFSEITAGAKTFPKILTELALNSYQMTAKSMHVCDLVGEMLDKFLDALQDDCFNSIGFSKAMSDPSNIIYLYDLLINKLKNEILQNYETNIYGTSNEIIYSITSNSKYCNSFLPNIIRDYFNSLSLRKLHWPPKGSCDLLYIFKNFCDESGIPQVLSQVIRMINPPDDSDSEQMLSTFLNELNWLQIIEVIIKGHFRTKFCDIIVTYSEKSINDLIDSHWWMENSLVLKCT